MQTSQNKNAIDVAKFVCALLVVMLHAKPFGYEKLAAAYYLENVLFRLAVPFFFVAAGFFLYRKTSAADFSFAPTWKYVKRIFRLYVIWTVVYFPLSVADALPFIKQEGWLKITGHYLQSFVVDGSYIHLWYFNALLVAVLLVSGLLYLKVTPRRIFYIALGLFLVGLLGSSYFGLAQPLRERLPHVWQVFHLAKSILLTTRDGLFEGFCFVSMGMLLAWSPKRMSPWVALCSLGVCIEVWMGELYVLTYLAFIRLYDTYIMMVPAVFFLFSWLQQLVWKDRPIYKTLRTLSLLIYLVHMWVLWTVKFIFKSMYWSTPWAYIDPVCVCTLVGSIAVEWGMLYLGGKFACVRALYS